MIRCYHCGTDNLEGSEYCDECGTKLTAASAPRAAFTPPSYQPPHSSQMASQAGSPQIPVPPPPPAFTREAITPKPATPYTPPPPPVFHSPHPPATMPPAAPKVVPPVQTSVQSPPPVVTAIDAATQTANFNGPTSDLRGAPFNPESGQHSPINAPAFPSSPMPSIRAKLIIQRGGKIGKEFPIAGTDALIGRWDADGGIFPDVDLDQDDPEAKVSRRHARVQFLNNQYLIEDLGSTNGTFVNRGPRLLPGIKQPLNNGDEIIVGKTFLKFLLS